jgi:hypothetical protein
MPVFNDMNNKKVKTYDKYAKQFKHDPKHEPKMSPKHYQYPLFPLSEEIIMDFFWEKMVQLNWKIDSKNLVLVCQECEKAIASMKMVEMDTHFKIEELVVNTPNMVNNHKRMCKAIGKEE